MNRRREYSRTGRNPARAWSRTAYLAALGFALLSPLTFRLDGGFLVERAARLVALGEFTPADAVDAARNVLLFAGWGLLEVITDSGRSRGRRLRAAVAGGAAIGMTAEVVQLGLPERNPALLDAVMNAGGAGIGALATDAAGRTVDRWRERPTALGVPTAALAVPYVIAVAFEAAFPALRNADAGIRSGDPLTRASWVLEHFRWESVATLPIVDFVLFLPAGVLLASALMELGSRRRDALIWTVVCGSAVAVAGQVAHAPLGRPIELGPALVQVAAFAGGGLVAKRHLAGWLRRSDAGERLRQFLWAYVVLLAVWRLRPFVPQLDPGAIVSQFSLSRWSPLSALAVRRELYTVSDVLRSFLLLLPLGGALAARERTSARGHRPAWRTAAAIVAVCVVLEGGQALVAGRFFDGTDLAVMAAGGLVGWSLTRERGNRAGAGGRRRMRA